ncbi:hypothetical protein VTO42DRAFT_5117 [Malbranchea cinnamomea]
MSGAHPGSSPDLGPLELPPVSEDLVPPRELKLATTVSITFDGLLDPPLLLREDPKDGCGGHIWPAGMQLSKYMLQKHRTGLQGKTMVELGAGSGLVGLAVAKGCHVDGPMYITDQAPMIPLIEYNIQLNGLSDGQVHAALLDWGDLQTLNSFPRPDIVLAADCVYFEPAFPLLLQTLEELLRGETVCYFCFKKRRKADLRFLKQAKKKFDLTPIEEGIDVKYCRKESIFLYEMRQRQPKRPQDNSDTSPTSSDTTEKSEAE